MDGGVAGRPTLGRHRAGQKRALWLCWTQSLVHAAALSPQRLFLPSGVLPLLCSSLSQVLLTVPAGLLSCWSLPESQPGPQSNPHLFPHPGLLVQAQEPKECRFGSSLPYRWSGFCYPTLQGP